MRKQSLVGTPLYIESYLRSKISMKRTEYFADCFFCGHEYIKAKRNQKYCSISCAQKVYYHANKKKIYELHAKYRMTHKETFRKWVRNYRIKHREEYNAYQKEYARKHKYI